MGSNQRKPGRVNWVAVVAAIGIETVLVAGAWYAGAGLRSPAAGPWSTPPHQAGESDAEPVVEGPVVPDFACSEAGVEIVREWVQEQQHQLDAPVRRRARIREESDAFLKKHYSFQGMTDPTLYDNDVVGRNLELLAEGCSDEVGLLGVRCDEDNCVGVFETGEYPNRETCPETWDWWLDLYGSGMSISGATATCRDGSESVHRMWGPVPTDDLEGQPERRESLDCTGLSAEACKEAYRSLRDENIAQRRDRFDAWRDWNDRVATELVCGD